MTNTFGIHALVWTGEWSEAGAGKAIASTKEAGFDLIELAVFEPSGFDTAMTSRLLAEYDIRASASVGLGDDTDVSSEDPETVRRGRAYLLDALHVVRDVGGSYFGGVIFSKLGRYLKPVSERGRANSIEAIAWLADEAAKSDITLGLEFCNRYETNVLNTTAQTLQFIGEVERDNVTVHMDVYHMNIEEASFSRAVHAASAAGKLGYVHVGESHRGALGTGSMPWDEFFTALRDVNYDGVITFESFSSEVVHPTLSTSLAIWRNTWSDGMELATAARDFLRVNYEERV